MENVPPHCVTHSRDAENQLLVFARRLLTPVARILIGRLPLEAVSNILKECMVQAAREKIAREQPAKRMTKSAIALLVGTDSRSVGKSTELDEAPQSTEIIDPLSRLIKVWANDPQWRDPETGRPRDLRAYGNGLTFQTLVRQSVGRSISYSEVVEVLMTEGNIERAGKRNLRLVNDDFRQRELWVVPRARLFPFFGDMYHCLGLNIQKTLEKSRQNSNNDPHLAGLVENWNIPAATIPTLRREISELMVPRGFEVDQILERYQNPDTDGPKFNAGIGWFYWEEPQGAGSVRVNE